MLLLKNGMVEIRITLEPEIYTSIVNYISSEGEREIGEFIEEVVMSYIEMHTEYFEEILESDEK